MIVSDQDGRDHRQAWDLIPWLVNGRASAEQRDQVLSHVLSCEDCRQELEFQQTLHAAVAESPTPALDPQRSFGKLRDRLDRHGAPGDAAVGSEAGAAHWRSNPGNRRGWTLRALIAAVVIEAFALAALGSAWLLQTHAAARAGAYQVLSAAAAPASTAIIRVVFAPDVSVSAMQSLLTGAGLQIVAGPSEAGVFSLAPLALDPPVSGRAALAALRANPQVRFAEPVSDAAVE